MNPINQILRLLQEQKFQQAAELAAKSINIDPGNSELHHIYALCLVRLKKSEEAIKHYFEALRFDPNNSVIHNNLGSFYYSQGRLTEAQHMFEKSIRLNPNSWEAHYNLANCFIKNNYTIAAIEHYLTTLQLNHDHADAMQNLAMAYVSLKEYSSALPYLKEVTKNNPDIAELQGHLAEAYLDLGMCEPAIAQYNLAINLEPSRYEWLHNLAVLYLRNDQPKEAERCFTKSLQINPNNPTAQHMLNALKNNKLSSADSRYVSDLFNQYASYYNQHMQENLKYDLPRVMREKYREVNPNLYKTLNILDLGCGTGLAAPYFRDIAKHLIGVDLSANMLAYANSLQGYDLLCLADINQCIPGENQQYFDLIIAADVFVYIGDLEKILQKIKSALIPDGYVIFTVENYTENSFKLQTTGRFAHSKNYLSSLAKKLDLSLEFNTITLRTNNNKNIDGLLVIAQICE